MTLNELFSGIATAIRNKKGTTGTIKATNFADEISSITLATGDATEGDVLSGKTFSKTGANGLTGTMTNNGAWGSTISAGGSATIPAGYHNGSGKVAATANSGNATTAQVLSGATFYSNSATKQTGAMTNRGAWGSTINPGGSVTIPAGYHNGSGVVSANGGAGRSRGCSWTYTTAKSFTERLDSGYSGKYVTQIFFFCSNDCRWLVFSNLYAIDTSGNEFAVFDNTDTSTLYLSYVTPINKYIDHFEWRVTDTQNTQGYDFVYCSALLVEYK